MGLYRSSLACAAGSLLLLFAPAVAAQPSVSAPPLTGRPAQFSNIVGRYHLTASAEPTTVPVEEPITLRLTIEGTGPAAYQPKRPHLRLFPERWSNDFYIEPVPEQDRHAPGSQTWEFVYRLRPKHERVAAIDGIKLVYYEPNKQGGGRFQTDYADAIALSVQPRPPAPPVPDHLPVQTAPPSFYTLPSTAALLAPAGPTWRASPWLLAVLLLVPPLLAWSGVRGWRRLFPGQAGRLQRERSGSARRALRDLGQEPAWEVCGRYLQERLDFPATEPTPAEVRRFLWRRGASRPVAEQFSAWFGACAAARFSPRPLSDADTLRREAGRLIQALEDDLCAS